MKAKIIKQIQQSQNNYIPFDTFMRIALYDHPGGYYTKAKPKIGRAGDFFTSVSVSPVFGEVIAKWIVNKIREDQLTANIVELGAGSGQLADNIIQALQKEITDFTYTIVESSPYHQTLIREKSSDIKVISSIEELAHFEGVILSNEFFDALPVKVARYSAAGWEEIGYTVQDDELLECTHRADQQIQEFIASLKISEPIVAQRIEVPIEMVRVYQTICERLERGSILSIDYGMQSADLRLPERRNGSLRGFYQHQLVDDVLLHIGEMDITANVLFDVLEQCGVGCGLTTLQMVNQHQFLLDHGLLDLLVEHHDPNPFSEASKRNRAIVQFISGGNISDFFYILEQKRG